MLRKALISTVLTGTLLCITPATYASEGEVIMKMLLNKGVITQEEYDKAIRDLNSRREIDKRLEAIEKKTRELESSTAEQNEWASHVDKHITHAEGPAFADGINIAAGVTMTGQGTDGNDKNPAGEDVIDGSISADLEISVSIGERSEAFIGFEAGSGTGLADELDFNADGEPDLYWGFNADAGPDTTLDFTEAWYEHSLADGKVMLTIGELDMTNYFDGNDIANDETTQFLADGFVNDPTIEFVGGPGIRLSVSPLDIIQVSIGIQSDGWEDLDEKNFLIAEVDIKPEFHGLQGNYRIYTWTNRGDHTADRDPLNTGEHGAGIGISADQQVFNFMSLFARLGFRNNNLREYEFDTALSSGAAVSGSLWKRDNDILGLAYGRAFLTDHRRDDLRNSGSDPGDEEHYEVYYSFMFNEHVTITPDIQVVNSAQGNKDFKTIVIGGVRGQVTF